MRESPRGDSPYPASPWGINPLADHTYPARGDVVGYTSAGDGLFPRCQNCDMLINPNPRYSGKHAGSKLCDERGARLRQHERAVQSAFALRELFSVGDDPLERVEVFRYLGRLIAMGDDDAQAVRACLKKARRAWARMSRVLRRENVGPRTSGKFFQAVVQAVLLYGSESWNLNGVLLKELSGFQIRAAWRMNVRHRPREGPDGEWEYPSREDALSECGLRPIEDYIRARRDTIARYVAERPVYEACLGGERRRGTSPRQYWWEQPMDLPDEAIGNQDAELEVESEE